VRREDYAVPEMVMAEDGIGAGVSAGVRWENVRFALLEAQLCQLSRLPYADECTRDMTRPGNASVGRLEWSVHQIRWKDDVDSTRQHREPCTTSGHRGVPWAPHGRCQINRGRESGGRSFKKVLI